MTTKLRKRMSPARLGTRAVETQIEAGNYARCVHCKEPVKFNARHKIRRQVIANVYVRNRWNRVEHFHLDCYTAAGEPHGPIIERRPTHGFTKPKES